MRSVMDEIADIFTEDKSRNAIVANYHDLRRKEEPLLSIPGLKRFCESHSRFRKIIIETSDPLLETRHFFKANNNIPISEFVQVPLRKDVHQGVTWQQRSASRPEPEPQKSEKKSPNPLPVANQDSAKPESLPSPPQQPKKRYERKGGRRKLNLSDAERQRRSENMKKIIAKRRSNNG